MQILHPFTGSVQQYLGQLADPDQHRPDHCPQCRAKHPLTAHGFYTRTIVDAAFDADPRATLPLRDLPPHRVPAAQFPCPTYVPASP